MRRDIILIVDASLDSRTALSKLLSDNHTIMEAENGEQAIQIIDAFDKQIAIILLDFDIPKICGLEVLRYLKIRSLLINIPVIMITGEVTTEEEKTAYDLGVSEVIIRPIDPYIVLKRIEMIIDLYVHKNTLEELVEKQTETLKEQAKRLKTINNQVIETLNTVVEFRSLESGKHIRRIKNFTSVLLEYVARLFEDSELTPEKIQVIASAATMHDVGKISIPDTILLKPGKLTKEEFEIMKLHTIHGGDIINSVASKQEDEYFRICYNIARSHHERYDGNGYPDKLKGDDIPFEAQIVAVADVYDALISKRVYKKAYTTTKAYEMIMNGECGVFSPKVKQCFMAACAELEEVANHAE